MILEQPPTKRSKKADYEVNASGSTVSAAVDVNDHEHLDDSLTLLRTHISQDFHTASTDFVRFVERGFPPFCSLLCPADARVLRLFLGFWGPPGPPSSDLFSQDFVYGVPRWWDVCQPKLSESRSQFLVEVPPRLVLDDLLPDREVNDDPVQCGHVLKCKDQWPVQVITFLAEQGCLVVPLFSLRLLWRHPYGR